MKEKIKFFKSDEFAFTMARRDRTDEFVSYRLRHQRNSYKNDENSYSVALPPAWMEDKHDIEYDLQRIENKCMFQFTKHPFQPTKLKIANELAALHKKHLLPGFSASDVEGSDEVDILTADITRVILFSFINSSNESTTLQQNKIS